MNSETLIEYLEGNLSVHELVLMMRRLRGRKQLLQEDGFFSDDREIDVTVDHLIHICDDMLSGELDPMSMETLSFLMIGADGLHWNADTPEGALVAETLDDWATPELSYPLTHDNVKIIREGLYRGECLGGEVSSL